MTLSQSSKTQNYIEIQEFRFDPDDDLEMRLARYLLQAPKGEVRSRMKKLILAGMVVHRQNFKLKSLDSGNKSSATKKMAKIARFYFDKVQPLELACYEYIRTADMRKRKARILRLMKLGYEARNKSR
jgi:hypothetical protein